jgi:hypothetical protein
MSSNGMIRPTENRPVNPRMERLDPPVHHLRKPRVLGDVDDVHPLVAEELRGSSGGKNLESEFHETFDERPDSGFIADADERTA